MDSELDARDSRLAEIAAALGDESVLIPLRRRAAVTAKLAGEVGGKQRGLDDAIAELTGHIETAEAKLYSGSVTSSRELTDLQADIDQLKRRRGEQEDLLLAVLEELDQATTARDERAKRLARAERTWKTEQESMASEQQTLQREVESFSAQRDDHAAAVPATELALYDHVRKGHGGIAVAVMRNSMCEACRVTLPNRTAGEVRTSATPIRCPNCGRILLVD